MLSNFACFGFNFNLRHYNQGVTREYRITVRDVEVGVMQVDPNLTPR